LLGILVSQATILLVVFLSMKEREKLTAALLSSARNADVARAYANPNDDRIMAKGPIA
jgi:hypothetical protein